MVTGKAGQFVGPGQLRDIQAVVSQEDDHKPRMKGSDQYELKQRPFTRGRATHAGQASLCCAALFVITCKEKPTASSDVSQSSQV